MQDSLDIFCVQVYDHSSILLSPVVIGKTAGTCTYKRTEHSGYIMGQVVYEGSFHLMENADFKIVIVRTENMDAFIAELTPV